MNPNELRQKKGELLAQAKAIQSELDAKDCDLTAEQRQTREARVDKLIDEAQALEAQAKAAEQREQAARERADRLAQLEQAGATPPGRRNAPDEGQSARVEVGEPAFTRDPMKGFAKPREFFQAVIAQGATDPRAASDERLRYLAAAGSDEHQTLSDPYGGFLVPEGMSPNLMTVGADENPLAGRVQRVPMDTPSLKIPARVDKDHSTSVSGGLVVSRRAETAAAAASRLEMEQVKLEANSLFGFSYATEELLRDSPRSVAALLGSSFGEEFASRNVLDLLYGSGVGEPLGVINSPALVTIAKESGQAAKTLAAANILKMRARAWRYSRQNSVWIANPDTYEQLTALHITGTNGDVFLFNPARGDDTPDTLLGAPVVFNEYAETLGTPGDLVLVSRASEYLYGVYQPLESAESIHVRFDRHERAFKFWLRDAGAPWWRSALTPKKGANTLSPFVALAARA